MEPCHMFKELPSIGGISAEVSIQVGVVRMRVIRILRKSITQVAAFLMPIGSLEFRRQLFHQLIFRIRVKKVVCAKLCYVRMQLWIFSD